MNMIFRFDDVCINTDMVNLNGIAGYLYDKFQCHIWYCISPLCFELDEHDFDKQRVYPKILNACSDLSLYYRMDKLGIPAIPGYAIACNHGALHVDHRLLGEEGQRISIVLGSTLTGSHIFVPPFHKWDKTTEKICAEEKMELVKFEDGWCNVVENKFDSEHGLWYMHSREITVDWIEKWTSTQ